MYKINRKADNMALNNEDILKKAIEKAVKGGYKTLNFEHLIDHSAKLLIGDGYSVAGLILSHDFAKAFWGDKEIERSWDDIYEAWEYHLQQMVLEKNPLKYLEKFI